MTNYTKTWKDYQTPSEPISGKQTLGVGTALLILFFAAILG